jgi:membrane-associated phospholipid phosphatase
VTAARIARTLAGFAVLWLALVGVGLLLTKVIRLPEARVERAVANDRTSTLNTITHLVTLSAETVTVVVAVALLAVIARLVTRRWRTSMFLVLAVAGQSAVFLATTLLVDRPRPDVAHLDQAPPTSSFPSGHTGAATALWVALAVATRNRALAVLAVLVPLAVGSARLYRGMHHPSDIVLGAVNGLVCVAIAWAATKPHATARDGAPETAAAGKAAVR